MSAWTHLSRCGGSRAAWPRPAARRTDGLRTWCRSGLSSSPCPSASHTPSRSSTNYRKQGSAPCSSSTSATAARGFRLSLHNKRHVYNNQQWTLRAPQTSIIHPSSIHTSSIHHIYHPSSHIYHPSSIIIICRDRQIKTVKNFIQHKRNAVAPSAGASVTGFEIMSSIFQGLL